VIKTTKTANDLKNINTRQEREREDALYKFQMRALTSNLVSTLYTIGQTNPEKSIKMICGTYFDFWKTYFGHEYKILAKSKKKLIRSRNFKPNNKITKVVIFIIYFNLATITTKQERRYD